MEPLRLSDQEFVESFKYVPRVSVNLLITDSQGRVLLTKRNIPPFEGYWHFPGSYLFKNETIASCQKRVAEKEFGLSLEGEQPTLLGAFEDMDKDPRGHVIDLLYGLRVDDTSSIQTTSETLEVRFFEKLPRKMGFNHLETLIKLGYQVED